MKTPKRATKILKTTVRKQKVVALKRPPPFTLKISVNIARTLKCTWHWSWNVLNAFGTITTKFVPYAITMQIPEERNCIKEGFLQCHDCGAITHKNAKIDVGNQFLFPFYETNETKRTKTRINFSFLSNCCVFGSFGHWFSIKSISRVFHNNNNNNNNNNNKSRFSLGVFTVEPETIVRKKEELMDLNLVINEIQNKLRL